MRNHASAAHPNSNHLTALKLADYTETCIDEVITLQITPVMFHIKTLLRNIKEKTASRFDTERLSEIFQYATKDQIESLAKGIFGIYVKETSSTSTRKNCELVLKEVWTYLSEPARQNIGLREARFAANLDTEKAQLSAELLKNIGAASYLPDDLRIKKIYSCLDTLKRAHHDWDNFYNEPAPARELESLIGSNPAPAKVQLPIVDVIVECFLGRPTGVSNGALPAYLKIIEDFSVKQAEYAMYLLANGRFTSLLTSDSPQNQALKLSELISPILTLLEAKELAQKFSAFPVAKLNSFHKDTSNKKLLLKLSDHLDVNED